MEDEEALSAYGMGKRGSQSHPLFAAPLSSGRTGPGCGRAESGTAWLPAPLVWTWVRAHRQLLAGNAGLRPATTSIPSYPAWDKARVMLMQHPCQERLRSHPFSALHMQEQWFCAHAETRSALTQVVSQKDGENCIVDCSTTFPRLSRARHLRNGEDVANLRVLLRLRFAEKCAEHVLHDVPRCGDC